MAGDENIGGIRIGLSVDLSDFDKSLEEAKTKLASQAAQLSADIKPDLKIGKLILPDLSVVQNDINTTYKKGLKLKVEIEAYDPDGVLEKAAGATGQAKTGTARSSGSKVVPPSDASKIQHDANVAAKPAEQTAKAAGTAVAKASKGQPKAEPAAVAAEVTPAATKASGRRTAAQPAAEPKPVAAVKQAEAAPEVKPKRTRARPVFTSVQPERVRPIKENVEPEEAEGPQRAGDIGSRQEFQQASVLSRSKGIYLANTPEGRYRAREAQKRQLVNVRDTETDPQFKAVQEALESGVDPWGMRDFIEKGRAGTKYKATPVKGRKKLGYYETTKFGRIWHPYGPEKVAAFEEQVNEARTFHQQGRPNVLGEIGMAFARGQNIDPTQLANQLALAPFNEQSAAIDQFRAQVRGIDDPDELKALGEHALSPEFIGKLTASDPEEAKGISNQMAGLVNLKRSMLRHLSPQVLAMPHDINVGTREEPHVVQASAENLMNTFLNPGSGLSERTNQPSTPEEDYDSLRRATYDLIEKQRQQYVRRVRGKKGAAQARFIAEVYGGDESYLDPNHPTKGMAPEIALSKYLAAIQRQTGGVQQMVTETERNQLQATEKATETRESNRAAGIVTNPKGRVGAADTVAARKKRIEQLGIDISKNESKLAEVGKQLEVPGIDEADQQSFTAIQERLTANLATQQEELGRLKGVQKRRPGQRATREARAEAPAPIETVIPRKGSAQAKAQAAGRRARPVAATPPDERIGVLKELEGDISSAERNLPDLQAKVAGFQAQSEANPGNRGLRLSLETEKKNLDQAVAGLARSKQRAQALRDELAAAPKTTGRSRAAKGPQFAGEGYNPEMAVPMAQQEAFLTEIFGPGGGGREQEGPSYAARKNPQPQYVRGPKKGQFKRGKIKPTIKTRAEFDAEMAASSEAFAEEMAAGDEKLNKVKNKGRVKVGAPPEAAADAKGAVSMFGPHGAIVDVHVTNWPQGGMAGIGAAAPGKAKVTKAEAEKLAAAAGVEPEEEDAEAAAKAFRIKSRASVFPNLGSLKKVIGDVDISKFERQSDESIANIRDFNQDTSNYARQILEENPVRALSVAFGQVLVNLTGRAGLKDMLIAINRDVSRANRIGADAVKFQTQFEALQASLVQASADLTDAEAGGAPEEAIAQKKQRVAEIEDSTDVAKRAAKDELEALAKAEGVPTDLMKDILKGPGPTATPKQIGAFRDRVEKGIKEAMKTAGPETVLGERRGLEDIRVRTLAKTAAVGTIGIVGGTLLFQAAMAAASLGVQAFQEGLARAVDTLSGWDQTMARVLGSFADAALSSQKNSASVTDAGLAAAMFSKATIDALGPELAHKVAIEAGTKAFEQQIDTFRATYGSASADKRLLTETTGGLPLVQLGGQRSIRELMQIGLQDFSQQSGAGGVGFGGSRPQVINESAEDLAKRLKGAAAQVDQWNSAAKRGFSQFRLAPGQGGKFDPNSAWAKQLKALSESGITGGAEFSSAMRSRNLMLVDAQGKAIDSADAFLDFWRGVSTGGFDPEALKAAKRQQLSAQIQASAASGAAQRQLYNPAQRYVAGLARGPLLGLNQALPPSFVGQGTNYQEANQNITKINAGLQEARNRGQSAFYTMVVQADAKMQELTGHTDNLTGQFGSLSASIKTTGEFIQHLQLADVWMQVNLQTHQYDESIRLANQSLADAVEFTTGVKQANSDGLGVLQKQTRELQKQSQILSFQQQQRQINFQVALAGFVAPGVTPEERAARIEEAKKEAAFAQQQLDLQKQSFTVGQQIIDVQAGRQITNILHQLDLLKEGRQVTIDVAINEQQIAAAQESLNNDMADIQSVLGQAEEVNNSIIQTGAELVAALGGQLQDYVDIATTKFQTFFLDMVKWINGGFANAGADAGTNYSYINGKLTQTQGGMQEGVYQQGGLGMVNSATSMIVGEAGGEAVAILRNPRQMMGPWGGTGGGSTTIQMVFTGNTVRSDNDLEVLASTITRKVEESMSRKASLLGMR